MDLREEYEELLLRYCMQIDVRDEIFYYFDKKQYPSPDEATADEMQNFVDVIGEYVIRR